MWRRRTNVVDLTLRLGHPSYRPRTVREAQKALELGVIDIPEYVELSLSMEPVADRLDDPVLSVRREAIFRLARHENRAWAVSKLQELAREGDEERRLYAAQALEQLDTAYLQAFRHLEERRTKTRAHKDSLLLALVYLDYVNAGLPGASLGCWYLRKAIGLVDEVLSDNPRSAEALHVRGKLWKALGQPQKAVQDLREALRLRPMEAKIYLDLAEAFFLLGDYDSVRHCCRYASQSPLTPQQEEVVNFWLAPESAEAANQEIG
jgi:tetratricopeptide (TPR) repeat protein